MHILVASINLITLTCLKRKKWEFCILLLKNNILLESKTEISKTYLPKKGENIYIYCLYFANEYLRLSARLKNFSHLSHLLLLIFSWTSLICLLRSPAEAKGLLHFSHKWSFIPSWTIAMWVFKLPAWAKVFPQSLHLCFFTWKIKILLYNL